MTTRNQGGGVLDPEISKCQGDSSRIPRSWEQNGLRRGSPSQPRGLKFPPVMPGPRAPAWLSGQLSCISKPCQTQPTLNTTWSDAHGVPSSLPNPRHRLLPVTTFSNLPQGPTSIWSTCLEPLLRALNHFTDRGREGTLTLEGDGLYDLGQLNVSVFLSCKKG